MKLSILTLIMLIGLTLSAQDKKATALLNEVAEKTQSFEHITIEFEYKMINKSQGINETMKGTLYSKGDKYKLDVAGQQIISDGKTMWTILESVNEVQINEADDDDDGFNPRNFLDNWSERFKAKMIKDAANEALIQLDPLDSSNTNTVKVRVDKNKKQLLSIAISDDNGSEFVYTITKFITNQPIADKVFDFNPKDHPDLEVIDLR